MTTNEVTEKQEQPVRSTSKEVRKRWKRLRYFPIWQRVLFFGGLLLWTVLIGLLIGYSGIGDGAWTDVFRASTWQHIFDIYRGVE